MTTTSFIPYAKQSVNADDIEAVSAVLKSGSLTRGPKLAEFEAAIANECGATYAVAFNSASSGLAAACFAAKVNSYDRIVTTPNSFIATIACGMRMGAAPLFIDIDGTTGNLDLEKLKHNVHYSSSRGRNIYIPVHFAGIPVDIKKLEEMIDDPEAVIIEDAAHALGSSYPDGEKVGSCAFSQMTVFSFHPAKTITTGEGGAVTTNDEEYYKRLLLYRNNGIQREELKASPGPWYYEVLDISGNYFMSEIQAALGISQLMRLNAFAEKRRQLVTLYRSLLEGLAGVTPLSPPCGDEAVAYHLFVVRIDFDAYETTREIVMEKLLSSNVGTQVHYIPLYKHPFFTKGRHDISTYFPEMEAFYSQALSLPLFYDLTEEQVRTVVDELTRALKK